METLNLEVQKRLIKKKHEPKKFTEELNNELSKKYLNTFHKMNLSTYDKLNNAKSSSAYEMHLKKINAINKHFTFIYSK